jgi:hypothetical protein
VTSIQQLAVLPILFKSPFSISAFLPESSCFVQSFKANQKKNPVSRFARITYVLHHYSLDAFCGGCLCPEARGLV